MKIFNLHRVPLSISFIIIFITIFLLITPSASAEGELSNVFPNPANTQNYATRGGPVSGNRMYLSVGWGEHISYATSTYIYPSGSGTVNLTINEATACYRSQPGGGGTVDIPPAAVWAFTTWYEVFDAAGNMVANTSAGTDCTSPNRNISFGVSVTNGPYRLISRVVNSNVSGENLYYLTITGGPARMGAGPRSIGGMSFSNRDLPFGYESSYAVYFATECTGSTIGSGGLTFYDADRGIYQGIGSYPELTVNLSSRPRGSTGGWTPVGGTVTLTGGDKDPDYMPGVSFPPNTEFRLALWDLTRPNAIEVLLADRLTQNNVGVDCVPDPDPPTNWDYRSQNFTIKNNASSSSSGPSIEGSTVLPGTVVDLRGRVLNFGDGTGRTYQYRLQRQLTTTAGIIAYAAVSGGTYNSQPALAAGAYSQTSYSSFFNADYSIPAVDGSGNRVTRACFRATIYPASGQSTPTSTSNGDYAFSSERCVNVSAPTTSCSASNVSGFVNNTISFSATVTSSASSGYTLKGHHRIGSGSYSPWGNISGSTFTGSETFSTPGTRTITIQVGLFTPSTSTTPTSGTTSTCTLTVTVYALPTCTAPGSFDVWAGQQFRSFVTITNTASTTLNVTTHRYTINSPAPRDNTVSTDAADISGGGSRSYSYGLTSGGSAFREVITTPGTYTITWYMSAEGAGAIRNSSGSNCTTTVRVRALPSCTARVWYQDSDGSWGASNGWYGREFGIGAEIDMGHDTLDQAASRAEYEYESGNGFQRAMQGTTINPTGNPSFNDTDNNATNSGSVYTYNGLENVRVWLPRVYNDQVSWEIDWQTPVRSVSNQYDVQPYSNSAECEADVDIRILALTCTPGFAEFSVGEVGRASLSLINPNLLPTSAFSDYRIKIVGDEWDDGTDSGDIQNQTSTTPTETYDRVQDTPVELASGTAAGTIYTGELFYTTAGVRTVNWTLVAAVGDLSSSTDSITNIPSVTPAGCTTEVEVSRRPYVRFYGNDVLAGSVLIKPGEACEPSDVAGISDVGVKSVGGWRRTSGHYQGSAAELATIATGTIRDFLPGTGSYRASGSTLYPTTPLRSSQDIRSSTGLFDYLAIGGGSLSLNEIGGDYQAGGLCNEIFPDPDDFADTGSIKAGSNFRDGDRYLTSSTTISGGTVPIGDRARIYVDGDVTITGNITYTNPNTWGSSDQVALIAIYATGDIRISGSVTQLDGLYVSGGTIETCDEFNNGLSVAATVAACGVQDSSDRQLTVRGAFVAENVLLGRTAGDVSLSNADPSGDPEVFANGGRPGERFIFLPELYIALWDLAGEGRGSTSGGEDQGFFDFISSPPPVF